MSRVLVVDDEAALRYALREVLEERGDEVHEAPDGPAALACEEELDVVITDLSMPGMDGLELMRALASSRPGLPVILLTARGSERSAVKALQAGAWDYLTKPFDIDEVCAAVARAAAVSQARREAVARTVERAAGTSIVGEAPVFLRLLSEATRVGRRNVSVLLRGETGTGKELIASLLHASSSRRSRPLVRFNCAALPAELAEAELFGHVRGAFTGATRDRPGYFQRADGGTLVLDEVGELPLALQPILLRALQSGEVQPVGASRPAQVDVRIVASTHRDLLAEVDAGRFREDLYYRLAVVELTVPALRDRPGDIPLLAEALRERVAERLDLPQSPLPRELLVRFQAHPWPGNVRELENALARLLALSEDGRVNPGDWRPEGRVAPASGDGLRQQVARFEREVLQRTLEETQGNQSEAARRLRVTRTTLLDKLERHGLR